MVSPAIKAGLAFHKSKSTPSLAIETISAALYFIFFLQLAIALLHKLSAETISDTQKTEYDYFPSSITQSHVIEIPGQATKGPIYGT